MQQLLADWWQQARDIVTQPHTFLEDADIHDLKGGFRFAGISIAVFSVLAAAAQTIIQLATAPVGTTSALVKLVAWFLMIAGFSSFVQFIAQTGIYQFLLKFGTGGVEKTSSAVAYSTAVLGVLGWIPIVNMVAFIYQFYIQYRGIREFHDTSIKKAVLVVVGGGLASIAVTLVLLFLVILLTSAVFNISLTLQA